MAAFRDTTGRPGPATWELGTYPEGQADFPVGGVSWYEAAAYAAFAGKSLPTAFHWYNAASFGNFSDIVSASNYGGKEPSYMFTDLDAQAPLDRQPTYGFRCVKYIKAPPQAAFHAIDQRARDFTQEQPVGDEIFEVIRRMYAYDGRPLKEAVDAVEDEGQWRKETVSFDAGYGNERVQAYLFLPKNAVPPFQTVIHFPPGGGASSRQLPMRFLDFIIRSGRAVMFPIYLGMFERRGSAATGPNGERDRTIAWSKDLG